MPVEEDKDKQEDQKLSEPSPKEEGKPPRSRRIMLAGIVFVASAIGIISAFYITQIVRQPEKGTPDTGKADSKEFTYLELEEFTANLGSEGEYLATKIILQLTNEDAKKEITENMPKFRDGILSILMSKNTESLLAPKGKELLKKDIMDKLNPKLTNGKISNIYFTEFLMQ